MRCQGQSLPTKNRSRRRGVRLRLGIQHESVKLNVDVPNGVLKAGVISPTQDVVWTSSPLELGFALEQAWKGISRLSCRIGADLDKELDDDKNYVLDSSNGPVYVRGTCLDQMIRPCRVCSR